jgi:hypothetical protein
MNEAIQNYNFAGVTAYGDPDAARRMPSLEARLAEFRREYCRDLVREGRLDWLGFDLEADLAEGSTEAGRPVGDRTASAEGRRSGARRWGVRRRR